MHQRDEDENTLSETLAEQGILNNNAKLVPVAESIRYRKRAQGAEKENENLAEQLARAKSQVRAMSDELNDIRVEQQLTQKLVAAGYMPVPTHPRDLIGDLPNIVAFIQGKLDAKDAALAAKQAEIVAHADANQFKAAFEDQIAWNDLIRQRCRIQDGYNEIQSWALALLIRRGARQ